MTRRNAAGRSDGNRAGRSPRPLRRRVWLRVLAFLVLFYVAWCATLYFYQDRLLFPRDLAPDPLPLLYDRTTVELEREVPGVGRVVAWFMPVHGSGPKRPAPLVIFFHGNAELIDYQSRIVEGYRGLGVSVLLPEYRGYGRSAGEPSERAIVADAVYFYDEIIKRPDVAASRIIFHGRSLGGGPAAALAKERRPDALVLESTFSSVSAMASKYYAPSFLVKNSFHSDRVVASLDVPTLIFHGARDNIIPVDHGRRLRDAALRGTYVEYDCMHNDFPGSDNEEMYWNEIIQLLETAGILEGPSS